MATQIDERTSVETTWSVDDGSDAERFAHYADKNDIMSALLDGVAITALCGKKWVPRRDPNKFPVCPTCKEIYEGLSE